jgi:hypothetical protein
MNSKPRVLLSREIVKPCSQPACGAIRAIAEKSAGGARALR